MFSDPNLSYYISNVPIITSPQACDPEYEFVKRSWRERLFTRPWEPRRKYNRVLVKLNPKMYKIKFRGLNTIVCHPSIYEQVKRIYDEPPKYKKGTPHYI